MASHFVIMNSAAPVDTPSYPSDRGNPFHDYTDVKFLNEFRVTKNEASYICNLVKEDMKCLGSRRTDLTLEQKVLVCLKTLASGSFQNCSKDFVNTSQPVVSKLLTAFTDSMVKQLHNHVHMPAREDIENEKNLFYEVAGFPGVLGCIDGTHIPIIAPPGPQEPMFVNRKNFHSLNVQVICDANLVFLDVNAKWHGSHHDSYILAASEIHDRFEREEFGEGWLLGDSGYSLKKWLMTPIENPTTVGEKKYNKSLKKTRCLVERAIGVLKSRFRILDHSGGYLCYKPAKVAKIIITCCILHNICRRNGTPIIDESDCSAPPVIGDDLTTTSPSSAAGKRQQDRLVHFFTAN